MCFLLKFLGTLTLTLISKLPRTLLCGFGSPSPLQLSTVSGCEPAGTDTLNVFLSSVVTLISVPSIASYTEIL